MELATFAVESAVQGTHWWFVVRRRLIARLIDRLALASDAAVLDIGTGTGTNLRLLRDLGFSNFRGLDLHDEAIRWCAEKGLGGVEKGDVCAMPFADESFALVLATDILEHVNDDARAIGEIHRVLKPGGTAVITVPAFESLWGLQDDVGLHLRRYRQADLLGRIEGGGLRVTDSFHFNWLLFVPIWLARQLIRLLRVPLKSEAQLNAPLINRALTAVFELDVSIATRLHPPFGVSILAVARRPH